MDDSDERPDPKPEPGDGPEYHADLAAWLERQDGKELVHATTKALEVPVAEFEGEWIRQMHGVLPSQTIEMPVGYARGTHLKFEIEVRVRDIAIKEIKGELTRVHTFAVEDHKVRLLGAYTADELDPGVGGNAAAGAEEGEDDA